MTSLLKTRSFLGQLQHQKQHASPLCYCLPVRQASSVVGPQSSQSCISAPVSAARATARIVVVPRAAAAAAPQAQATKAQANDDGKEFVIAVASVLNDTKCSDIVALDVSPLASWTSYMVFCSVFSKPQLMAALARVEKLALEKYGRQQQNVPGNSPWECLDFGDCLIHVMSVEQREYYDVEGFYATAEEVELPFEQEQPSPELQAPQWTREQAV